MLLSVVVALLIVELALRLRSPRYLPVIPGSYKPDGELAYVPRPDVHLFKTTDFQQESRVNKLGTTNFQENFDGYELLVFTLGDSYTQGAGVPADMSYPSQLDLILNQDEQGFYTRKFGVVNLGVAGYGGVQELISLRRWAGQLRSPAVILYVGCYNDFEDDLLFQSGNRDPLRGGLLRLLPNDSQISIRIRQALLGRARQRLLKEALKNRIPAPSVAELELPVLEKLTSYAKEYGALLIVSWSNESDSYYWLKSWANQNGVAFADWAPKANSVRAAMPALPMDNQHSGGHHRGWTNQIIAAEFARQIRMHKQ